MDAPIYLHLKPGDSLPDLNASSPFKGVVVVESLVAAEWQTRVSNWLVRSGCRYMMAWGLKCSDWDTSVDQATLAKFGYGKIPDNEFTMTTWHAKESLDDTFWFSQHAAMHPLLQLDLTYIVHIAPIAKEAELLSTFRAAQEQNRQRK